MSAATINTALSEGCNLFFTPGVYNLNQTLNVTHADTIILGIGYPTLIPQNGVNTMQVADVNGVRIKGLLFDAGTVNSAALLTIGTGRLHRQPRQRPDLGPGRVLPDRRRDRRQGHGQPGRQRYDTIMDDIWAWRADHGNSGTWAGRATRPTTG